MGVILNLLPAYTMILQPMHVNAPCEGEANPQAYNNQVDNSAKETINSIIN